MKETQASYELFSLGSEWKQMETIDVTSSKRRSWRRINCPALSERLAEKRKNGQALKITDKELRGGKADALFIKRPKWKRPCKLHEKVKVHSYVLVDGKRYCPKISPPKHEDLTRQEGNKHLERAKTRRGITLAPTPTKVVPIED
jgi:hypothetical protein